MTGKQGLYDPAYEHDACGIGFVAHIHGVVETGAGGGTLTPRFRSENAGTTVTIKTGSWGALYSP